MITFSTTKNPGTPPSVPEYEQREPLFEVDGTSYDIPVKFWPLQLLQYIHVLDQYGADSAARWALREALGDNGYFALIGLPAELVSKEQLAGLIGVVTGRLQGIEVVVPGPKPPGRDTEAQADGWPEHETEHGEQGPDDEPVL